MKSLGQAFPLPSYSKPSVIPRLGFQFQSFLLMYWERLAFTRLDGNVLHSAMPDPELALHLDSRPYSCGFLSATDQSTMDYPGIFLAFHQYCLDTQKKAFYSMNPVPGLQYEISITSPQKIHSSGVAHHIQDKIGCLFRTLMTINCGFYCRYSLNSWLNCIKDKVS